MAKKVGPLIDKLFKARAERLKATKVIEALKAKEELVRTEILQLLKDQGLDGAKGAVATAAITRTTVAQVTDWDEVYKYIKKTGEFDLLQKRMSDVAYRERLEAGKPVPGTEPFVVVNLSLTKSSKE
jgi:hypothetical protein